MPNSTPRYPQRSTKYSKLRWTRFDRSAFGGSEGQDQVAQGLNWAKSRHREGEAPPEPGVPVWPCPTSSAPRKFSLGLFYHFTPARSWIFASRIFCLSAN